MPTYTYHCENCGIRFDRYQKFTDEALTICPECGDVSLRKVFQPVGIVFKGKGFYATDHRSPSGQAHAGVTSEAAEDKKVGSKKTSESSNGESSEKTSSSSSESKPTTKSKLALDE